MKLKVWHIPQIPGKPFEVEVDSLETAKLLCDVLARYDIFQFENRIKPDFANMNGIVYLSVEGDWCDIDPEDPDEMDWFAELVAEEDEVQSTTTAAASNVSRVAKGSIMREETLKDMKRVARKMDYHPSTAQIHALIDSNLGALERITELEWGG